MNIEKEIRYAVYSVWSSMFNCVDNSVCDLVYNSVYCPVWELVDSKVSKISDNNLIGNIASEIKEYEY